VTGLQRPVWVSPLPPLETGISQYSRDILEAVGGLWRLGVVGEPGSEKPAIEGVRHLTFERLGEREELILHLGNSGFHPHAFELASRHSGIVVLHDVVLHHARLADYVRKGRGRDYVATMSKRYGPDGAAVAADILKGAARDLGDYPLSEDYIETSRMVVVHSEHAREQVLRHVPDARVGVVPMGIPLPELLDKQACRLHLSLPESAFIITSITHVNPMKRLPIVLRALRRLIERVPHALLVIAGSVAAGIDLERQVSLLGLSRHVRIMGYVSDAESRILARAGDVSVNLRYPSTGETSASLLRLMGAARPVIVTAHGAALEISEDAVLHLPVDRLEEETLAEYLAWLAVDEDAREALGESAREFVEKSHSMGATVSGYCAVIREAFDIDLPALASGLVTETGPRLRLPVERESSDYSPDPIHEHIADSLVALGLSKHDGTIRRVAETLVYLGFDGFGEDSGVTSENETPIAPELLEILACPVCKSPVRLEDHELVCEGCGRRYRIEHGIPIMLTDTAETG
jgi:glycosyltransferase involved in cell wall biosynthesis/uncharacterized protein YbaR (Trm112 family)